MRSKANIIEALVDEEKKPNKSCTANMREYYKYLLDNTVDISANHRYAFTIATNNFKLEIVEALLLAEADPEDIDIIFGIKKEVVDIYKELFFDTTKFITRLDKLAYVEGYSGEGIGRELKLRALHVGAEAIYATYGNYLPEASSQKKLLQRIFMAASQKAMEINFNSLSSAGAKAALAHAKVMLKTFETIGAITDDDGDASKEFLKILLNKDNELAIEISKSKDNAPVRVDKEDIV